MSDLQLIEDLNLIKSNIHHDLFKKDYDQSLETKDALKIVTEPNQLSQGLSNYPQESDYSLFIKESVETSDKFEHTIIRTFLKEMEVQETWIPLRKMRLPFINHLILNRRQI